MDAFLAWPGQNHKLHAGVASEVPEHAATGVSSEYELPSLASRLTGSHNDIRHSNHARKLFISDGIVICCGIAVAALIHFFRQPGPVNITWRGATFADYTVISVFLSTAWMIILGFCGTRSRRVIGQDAQEYVRVGLATLQLFGLIAIAALLLNFDLSRIYLVTSLMLGLAGLVVNRWYWRRAMAARLRRGGHHVPVLLVGTPVAAAATAANFAKDPEAGYRVVGVCTPDGPTWEADTIRVEDRLIPIVGSEEAVIDAVGTTGVHTVALTATDHLQPNAIRRLIWELDSLGVELMIAPGLVDVCEHRLWSRPVAGMTMLEVGAPKHIGANSAAKRVFDITFSAAAIISLTPVFLFAAVAVRLSGPGPIHYISERIGLNGTTFQMFKFRSMHAGADDRTADMITAGGGGPLFWKAKDDPRVTCVGKLLRRYSIDELPQFLNILRGEMSVVGPRPQVRREVDSYDDLIRRRLVVKPGLTGLWQDSGRSDAQVEDAVRFDLSYIENWSVTQDLVIILKTIKTALRGEGAY